jgi:energy-converting hydrogenase Eha subunit B
MTSRTRLTPLTVLPAVSLLSLVTVEFGGWSLLSLLTSGDTLDPFEEQFFRAGHGHAGVLLVLSLVVFVLMGRTRFSEPVQWVVGLVLLAGILLQSGGFFLHLLVGEQDAGSAGTLVTRTGAILIAVALITVAVGLLRAGRSLVDEPAPTSAPIKE